MHFGEQHKNLSGDTSAFSDKFLMGLAGNGMHVWSVAATLLCTIRLLAEVQHRRATAPPEPKFRRCATNWLDSVWLEEPIGADDAMDHGQAMDMELVGTF